MATAVKPLRLDGRSSAANVEVCGWGHPPRLAPPRGIGREHGARPAVLSSAVGIRLPRARSWGARRVGRDFQRGSDRRIPAGIRSAPHGTAGATRANGSAGKLSSAVERGHRRHNGRARTIGQLCCSIARKRVRYLRRCRSAGDDSDACGRGGSLRSLASHDTGRLWRHHGRERGPFGFSRWGRGKRLGEERAPARGLRDLRRRLILPPPGAPRMRKATTTNQNNPRRGRKAGEGSGEGRGFLRLSGCAGVPTGDADGRHSSRHHRRHIFRGV